MQICIKNENSWTHLAYLFVEVIIHNNIVSLGYE